MYYYLIRVTDNRNKLLCWDTDPIAIASASSFSMITKIAKAKRFPPARTTN